MLGFQGLCRTEVSKYCLVQVHRDMFNLEIYQQQAHILTGRNVFQQELDERSRGCQEQFVSVKNSITADYLTIGKLGAIQQKISLELLHFTLSLETFTTISEIEIYKTFYQVSNDL